MAIIPRCIWSSSGKTTQIQKALLSFLESSKKNCATKATFDVLPFRLHKLEQGPITNVSLTKNDGQEYYTKMALIRRIEREAAALYREKAIRGFCHLYSGQEACAVGIKAALRPQDTVITAYRCHGWTYVMGASVETIIAELIGRKTGCSRGKGGSMHMYTKNFYGGNGVVGSQVPVGVGIAFAHKYVGSDAVCVIAYGDGAANQGQVYEAFNMAKLWNIPCIFVCENNGFAMGTSISRSSASTEFYTRGDYVPGMWVDGMDVLAVREATRFAVAYCVSGQGPILMEAATYRYSGHSLTDPGTTYRTRHEIEEVRKSKDPITGFRKKLTSSGLFEEGALKKIDDEVKSTVDEAVKKAKTDPVLGLEELVADIYSAPAEPYVRGVTPWDKLKHITVVKPLNL